ncbi:MAG TPA: SecY family transport protein, partial [Vampirovibrionales bacterium]
GASLLIFAGIAVRLPSMFSQTLQSVEAGSTPTWGIITLIAFFILVIIGIIYIQEGARKLLIVGSRGPSGGQSKGAAIASSHYLPLKVNPAGVLPIIFAQATMFMPIQLMLLFAKSGESQTVSAGLHSLFLETKLLKPLFEPLVAIPSISLFFDNVGASLDRMFGDYHSFEYSLFYGTLIVTFAFFYASILFNPREMAENLQKGGSAIQGVKPGKPTSAYIEKILSRVVLIGAILIGAVTILPIHVEKFCQVMTLGALGGTSLIIMVGVAIDLYNQIMAHSQTHQYKVRSLLTSRFSK